eukprot:m51a1_g8663 hypothetical protein (326) ;mRNA; f:91145-92536
MLTESQIAEAGARARSVPQLLKVLASVPAPLATRAAALAASPCAADALSLSRDVVVAATSSSAAPRADDGDGSHEALDALNRIAAMEVARRSVAVEVICYARDVAGDVDGWICDVTARISATVPAAQPQGQAAEGPEEGELVDSGDDEAEATGTPACGAGNACDDKKRQRLDKKYRARKNKRQRKLLEAAQEPGQPGQPPAEGAQPQQEQGQEHAAKRQRGGEHENGRGGQARKEDVIVIKQRPLPPCKFWSEGTCKKGVNCPFPHEGPPGKRLDVLCKFFLGGHCAKGDNCNFSHDRKKFPCQFFQEGNSPGVSTSGASDGCAL